MKPYYADSNVTLYHGDCLEVTEWLAADVLVMDPPYGMAFQSGYRAEAHAPIAGDKDTRIRDGALALWGTKPANTSTPSCTRGSPCSVTTGQKGCGK